MTYLTKEFTAKYAQNSTAHISTSQIKKSSVTVNYTLAKKKYIYI